MAFEAAVVRGVLSTVADGTQDHTSASFGTPQAAISFSSHVTTNDTGTNSLVMSIGFCDGSGNQGSVGGAAETGQTTTDTERASSNADAVGWTLPGTDIVWSVASLITDGIRFTNHPAVGIPNSAYYVNTLLMKGLSDSAAGTFTENAGTAVPVTLTFEPDVVFLCYGRNKTGLQVTNAALANFGMGIVHNGASLTQKSMAFSSPTAVTTVNSSLWVESDAATTHNNNSAEEYTGTLGSFSATGFTWTPSTTANGGDIHYLAIKFAAGDTAKVFDFDSPTATGSEATTGVGFTPTCGLIMATSATARDAIQTSDADGFGFTIFDGTNEYSLTGSDDDGVTTSLSSTKNVSGELHCLTSGTTEDAVATFTSFDSDGWTWNYATAPGTARKYIGFAIGSTAGNPIPVFQNYYRQQR